MSGDLALVTAGIFGLMVIDFSDPSNPKLIGSADTPGSFEGVAVSGNLALVTEFLGGLLRVIDIADPHKSPGDWLPRYIRCCLGGGGFWGPGPRGQRI